ncbi:MAG: hypothetical protein GY791_21105 [Alphaproteobacteria bacterium]|nr:hypothetical protein [Alphaproteobacteria bacterium]
MTKLATMMVIAVGLAFLLVGPRGANAEDRVLTAVEIEAVLDGATAHGTGSRGAPYQVRYGDGGAMSLTTNSGFTDSGEWSLDGDLYCAQWQKVRDGDKGCWKVVQKDDRNFRFEGVDGMDDHELLIE